MKLFSIASRAVAAAGLTFALAAPAFAIQPRTTTVTTNGTTVMTTTYSPNRISTLGRITRIQREGDVYRVTLNRGEYSYLVPAASLRHHQLKVGDLVRMNGLVAGENVNADEIAWQGEAAYASDPMYRPVPFGSTGWMSGVVQSTNRHLGYLTIRDDSTGQLVKVDVRNMKNRRHPVDIWAARPGDHISVNGSWEHQDTFDANLVEY